MWSRPAPVPSPPNALDGTFGPQAVFVHASPAANTSPLDSAYQHFGEVEIDGRSRALSVRLRDGSGAVLWSNILAAAV
jgi:alkaline phosphatase D